MNFLVLILGEDSAADCWLSLCIVHLQLYFCVIFNEVRIRSLCYVVKLSFLRVTRPQTQRFTSANDNYLRQGGYVIIIVCLSHSNFAQKRLNGFA